MASKMKEEEEWRGGGGNGGIFSWSKGIIVYFFRWIVAVVVETETIDGWAAAAEEDQETKNKKSTIVKSKRFDAAIWTWTRLFTGQYKLNFDSLITSLFTPFGHQFAASSAGRMKNRPLRIGTCELNIQDLHFYWLLLQFSHKINRKFWARNLLTSSTKTLHNYSLCHRNCTPEGMSLLCTSS